MRVILDTSALWSRQAVDRIADEAGSYTIPAVAYAERVRQYSRAKRPSWNLDATLERLKIQVEPFTREFALRFVPRLTDDAEWKRLYRDAMIAGHVGPADVLWTGNPKDFLAVGLREDQVVAV